MPDSFDWEADRPIALVIVRSGMDGEEVSFHVGPARFGTGRSALVGDGTGIRYVAFCYDAPVEGAALVPVPVPALLVTPAVTAPVAAARVFVPTARERRSLLSLILPAARRTTGGAAG